MIDRSQRSTSLTSLLSSEALKADLNLSRLNQENSCFLNWKVDEFKELILRQKEFYNHIKFPNFNATDTYSDLIEKGTSNPFTSCLDKEIPMNSDILEVGCGTGQLSLFLSRYKRRVVGVDISNESLKVAEDFRKKNSLNNCFFIQADLFKLPFKEAAFDIIICNGVLHHTTNAQLALVELTKALKPGGKIILGLYHFYGRICTVLKQKFYKLVYNSPTKYSKISHSPKSYAWFLDQYLNPHETRHTIHEVLNWLEPLDINPLTVLPYHSLQQTSLFARKSMPSGIGLKIFEFSMAFNKDQHAEGGFFIIIGEKTHSTHE